MNAEYDAAAAFTSATLDELLNLDFLAGSSTGSRSASSSPKLPPTPPQIAPEPLFNFLLDDAYTKVDPFAVPPTTGAPYDFLSTLNFASATSGSPDSATTAVSPTGMFAIDPQLVGTPTPSKALSDVDEDEELEDEDDHDEPALPEPIKVGGKGKNRKGTVQSGGIEKKPISVPRSVTDKKSEEPDDWRPSPEEYKKMSSKEKRQLRNKISARNFRVRRKEYITTLEGDISERDRLIDAIRSELGSTKAENVALREEIDALKKALLNGGGPVLPPPGPLPAVPAAITATAQAKTPAPPLVTPNTQKDLPTSPRLGANSRAFWAGNTASFANITPVHTTLIPEFPAFATAATLAGKAPGAPQLQENINPSLNFHIDAHPAGFGAPAQTHAFDSFADVNPFTLKTLDAYRMQLWGKMAAHQHAARAYQQQQALRRGASPSSDTTSPPSSPHLGGLAANLRPAFFTGGKTPATPSAVLAGKAATSSSALHTPPPPSAEAVAALASQTLFRRLGSAFWDAFSGASAGGPDADKVRRVLEGKAVVRVVDVDQPPAPAPRPAPTPMQAARAPSSPKLAPVPGKCSVSMTDLLEESMRTLSISKKSSV